MSSPMMTRMLGFCCCADAGSPATMTAISDASRLRQMSLLAFIVASSNDGTRVSVHGSDSELQERVMAISPHVAVADVVGENERDIRLRLLRRCRRSYYASERGQESEPGGPAHMHGSRSPQ